MAGAGELWEFFGDVPGAPGEIDWDQVERDLSIEFPADYKEFCSAYPALMVNDLLLVMHPCTDVVGAGYPEASNGILDMYRESRSARDYSVPYPLFPEPGGLLPWGYDRGGAYLFWKTEGEPENWTIVVNCRVKYCEHEMGFSDFLAGFLGDSVECPNLPQDFSDFGVSAAAAE
ncbi:SMI1/KNR4 family protein [Crossiella sp. CA198]|uniref:SMI1/KNR4 family protein n=1 Tax=Crossiella sp. CA198 TaxID=3455607 RepID=UPI003F8D1260